MVGSAISWDSRTGQAKNVSSDKQTNHNSVAHVQVQKMKLRAAESEASLIEVK